MLRGPVMSLRVIRSCKAGFQALRAPPALFGALPSVQPRLCRSAFPFMRTALRTAWAPVASRPPSLRPFQTSSKAATPRPADCTVPKQLSSAINASISSLGDTLLPHNSSGAAFPFYTNATVRRPMGALGSSPLITSANGLGSPMSTSVMKGPKT